MPLTSERLHLKGLRSHYFCICFQSSFYKYIKLFPRALRASMVYRAKCYKNIHISLVFIQPNLKWFESVDLFIIWYFCVVQYLTWISRIKQVGKWQKFNHQEWNEMYVCTMKLTVHHVVNLLRPLKTRKYSSDWGN